MGDEGKWWFLEVGENEERWEERSPLLSLLPPSSRCVTQRVTNKWVAGDVKAQEHKTKSVFCSFPFLL